MSHVNDLFTLQPRPDHHKDKVSGSVHLELTYKDLSLPDEVQEALAKTSKLGHDSLQKLWKEYHGRTEDAPLKNAQELLELLKNADLIDPYLYAADPSLHSNSELFSTIRYDTEMMNLVAEEIFNAADADKSGSVDFTELVTTLSWQLGGTIEDKIRCKY
jgi:hypothetical protein